MEILGQLLQTHPIDAGEKVIVIKRHSTILQVKRRVNKYGSINVNDYFRINCCYIYRINNQNYSTAKVGVVERFGKFQRVMQPGLNLLIPIVIAFVYIMTYVFNKQILPPQKVITKDNVQVEIDTIIFYQVVEPELATYGISNYEYGVRNITSATMRQIIGKMELDETLSGREKFQQKFA